MAAIGATGSRSASTAAAGSKRIGAGPAALGVHEPEEKAVVRAEVAGDHPERARPVETAAVDRSLAEEQPPLADLQAWLDAVCILGDEPLQAADVLDFQLPERRSHHSL